MPNRKAIEVGVKSGKICDTDPVGSIGNVDLGVFAIP
jgi:hypothetical protein